MNNLGKKIQERRRSLKLELEQSASLAGITPAQWRKIESDKLRINDEWVPGIAASLGVTIAELKNGNFEPAEEGTQLIAGSEGLIILIMPGALERYAQSIANIRGSRWIANSDDKDE